MQTPRLELGSGESQSPILPGKLRLPIVNRVRGRPCSSRRRRLDVHVPVPVPVHVHVHSKSIANPFRRGWLATACLQSLIRQTTPTCYRGECCRTVSPCCAFPGGCLVVPAAISGWIHFPLFRTAWEHCSGLDCCLLPFRPDWDHFYIGY